MSNHDTSIAAGDRAMEADTASGSRSAARDGRANNRGIRNIGLWVLQAVAAAMFVMAGWLKLTGAEEMVLLYETIGIGQWFRYATGLIEIGAAAMLVVPGLAAVGAALLAATMVGAVLTHLVVLGDSPLTALILLVVVAVIGYARRGASRASMSHDGSAHRHEPASVITP